MQQGLGQSALFTGLIGLPNAAVSGYASLWSAKKAISHGRLLQVWALLITIVAISATIGTAYLIVKFDLAPAWICIPITPLGIGLGIMGSVNTTQAMLEVPVAHGGTAGGIAQTSQRISTAIGNSVVTAVLFASGANFGASKAAWFDGFAVANLLIIAFAALATVIAIVYYQKRPR